MAPIEPIDNEIIFSFLSCVSWILNSVALASYAITAPTLAKLHCKRFCTIEFIESIELRKCLFIFHALFEECSPPPTFLKKAPAFQQYSHSTQIKYIFAFEYIRTNSLIRNYMNDEYRERERERTNHHPSLDVESRNGEEPTTYDVKQRNERMQMQWNFNQIKWEKL